MTALLGEGHSRCPGLTTESTREAPRLHLGRRSSQEESSPPTWASREMTETPRHCSCHGSLLRQQDILHLQMMSQKMMWRHLGLGEQHLSSREELLHPQANLKVWLKASIKKTSRWVQPLTLPIGMRDSDTLVLATPRKSQTPAQESTSSQSAHRTQV